MKRLLLLLACVLGCFAVYAQQEYERNVFVSAEGDSLNYRLLRPEVETPGTKYPLVLFLHGAGERGNDNEKQLIHGGGIFLNPVNREKYPAYVVLPQCPEDGYWAYNERPESFEPDKMSANQEITPIFKLVKQLLDTYIANPQVDASRIYIIGLSMGGMGTFDMACRFPEVFAAAIPICGTVNPSRLANAKGVSFRIFHGDKDAVVPVEGSRDAYRALRVAGIPVDYIEFAGCGHGSWNPAFNYPGFMEWLFSQQK